MYLQLAVLKRIFPRRITGEGEVSSSPQSLNLNPYYFFSLSLSSKVYDHCPQSLGTLREIVIEETAAILPTES